MIDVIRRILAVLLLSSISITANALILQQAPYSFDGVAGGDGYESVGPIGSQVAENFQFAEDVTLTKISWWGNYDTAAPNDESFTVRIFESIVVNDNVTKPVDNPLYETTFLEQGNSTDIIDLEGGGVFYYEVAGISLFLQGGVDYYLSVFSNDNSLNWFWLESQFGDRLGWYREMDDTDTTHVPWILDSPNALNMAFRLEAEQFTRIPEPAVLFLFLIPLLWLFRREISANKIYPRFSGRPFHYLGA
ncbi:hypothetical protein [Nitrosomonas sp.]|uniref:hypothetical protein n=1 Tax=Nitrosomonas sp. TaxID=42353 RepID=UPI0026240010|nr:hypothetical protein [Nitrosomonas sp.]MCW5602534.1 hypothetical protein [Nitrosomonas sp.]